MFSSIDFVMQLTHQFDTGFTADSVEFLPRGERRHLLACATYQLLEEVPPKKIGKLYLFDTSDTESALTPTQTIDTGAILDTKWCVLVQKHHSKRKNTLETKISLLLSLWIDRNYGNINDSDYLAAAMVNGDVDVYECVAATQSGGDSASCADNSRLVKKQTFAAPHDTASALALSLDWNNRRLAEKCVGAPPETCAQSRKTTVRRL